MKKQFLPCLIFISFGNILIAQELAPETKPLAFKFSPGGLSFGKATLGVEYNVKYRNSVTFYAGIPLEKKKQVSYNGNGNDINTKAFSVMAGYRHYISDKNMKGFYFEPYVKYLKHNANGLVNYDINSSRLIFDSKSSYQGIAVGGQIGLQLIISRSIVVDLYLLGPEANSAKFSFTGKDVSNNAGWSLAEKQQLENDIRELLNDIPLVGNKAEVNVDTDNKTINTSYAGFLPGIRVGGSVGIRF